MYFLQIYAAEQTWQRSGDFAAYQSTQNYGSYSQASPPPREEALLGMPAASANRIRDFWALYMSSEPPFAERMVGLQQMIERIPPMEHRTAYNIAPPFTSSPWPNLDQAGLEGPPRAIRPIGLANAISDMSLPDAEEGSQLRRDLEQGQLEFMRRRHEVDQQLPMSDPTSFEALVESFSFCTITFEDIVASLQAELKTLTTREGTEIDAKRPFDPEHPFMEMEYRMAANAITKLRGSVDEKWEQSRQLFIAVFGEERGRAIYEALSLTT